MMEIENQEHEVKTPDEKSGTMELQPMEIPLDESLLAQLKEL